MDSSLASIVTELQKNPDHHNKRSGPQHHKEHFKLSKDGVVLRASKNNHWQIVVPISLLLQVAMTTRHQAISELKEHSSESQIISGGQK